MTEKLDVIFLSHTAIQVHIYIYIIATNGWAVFTIRNLSRGLRNIDTGQKKNTAINNNISLLNCFSNPLQK